MFGKLASEGGSKEIPSNQLVKNRNILENKTRLENRSSKLGSKIVRYEDRLRAYNKKRAEIFQDTPVSKRLIRSTKRLNTYWHNVKAIHKKVANTVASIQTKPNDLRPYAKVKIFEKQMLGLLDSGAQISCIGGSLAKSLHQRRQIKSHKSTIKTADGQLQVVFGKVTTPIEYKQETKNIEFFVVPSLQQDIILGIDFWSLFQIAPNIICEIETPIEEANDPSLKFHNLDPEQTIMLQNVKKLFPSYEKEGLGKTSLIEHEILIDPKVRPIKQRYFPISPAIEKLVHQEVDEMLKLGVIEEAPNSPWSSPVVLVRKSNKVRLCLDSRKVNSITVKDAYPLPHIEGILSRLPKAEYISSLDLRHAFWQIPLKESSKDLTCFTVPNRPLYRYVVMPFGLCNAPQTLCRLMDRVIPNHLRDEVFVYLDDLLVVSETFEKHLKVLSEVSKQLRKAGLTINVRKSKFCLKEVNYLGYVVGNGTLQTDSSRITAVLDFPPPKSVRQLRRFLGMAGWYRRFIENFANTTAPLTNLLMKGKRFSWSEEANNAFVKLKHQLTSAPVLASPDYSKEFFIQCDASKLGVGAVLTQLNDKGEEVPIAFFSKKLNTAQKNYSVTEQECLAVILSLKRFRPYVEGQEFTVVTDHASLQWLMRQSDLSGRLARWSLKLQGFPFKILHRKGSEHVVPDCLSRKEELVEELELVPIIDLSSDAFSSESYMSLIENVSKNSSKLPDLKIIDGKVYKRTGLSQETVERDMFYWKLWVPESLVESTIRNAHEPPNKCHGGISKTLERLRLNLYWPSMARDVKEFISNCETCIQNKSPNTILRPPISNSYQVERPFQKLYIDLLGPYPRSKTGNIGILIILDSLTKFPILKAIKKFSTKIVCDFLVENVFPVFGTPQSILSDNGKQFTSTEFKKLLTNRGIKHVLTAVYSPQANASERVNRSIITGIRMYIKKGQSDWDKCLPAVGEAIRSSIHHGTLFTPYCSLFGIQMACHGTDYELFKCLNSQQGEYIKRSDQLENIRTQIRENISKSFNKYSGRYNLRARVRKFAIGDIVYRRNFTLSKASDKYCAKFAPRFIKAVVVKPKGSVLYILKDVESGKVQTYHAKDIVSKTT